MMSGTRPQPTVSQLGVAAEYFEAMYAIHDDPWNTDSPRAHRRYDVAVALLPAARYSRAIEAGCGSGSLTERLAHHCDELFAFDLVDAAVARTRDRIDDREHVRVLNAEFPTFWPAGSGDLVVWAEIARYLNVHGAHKALHGLEHWLMPGGTVLVVNDRIDENDYPRSCDAVDTWLDRTHWLQRVASCEDEAFTAGVWTRVIP